MQRKITYIFDFGSENPLRYELLLNEKTMVLEGPTQDETPPDWTLLEKEKCRNCVHNGKEYQYCPVAKNLHFLVEHFKDQRSMRESKVGVVTEERTYLRKGSLQEGLFSIFGLIMATSGCEHLNFLKPMARFHIPFATLEETIVRNLSFYLLKKYINADSHEVTINVDELKHQLTEVNKVNDGMMKRVRSVVQADADTNAITILDSFATLLSHDLSTEFGEIKELINFD